MALALPHIRRIQMAHSVKIVPRRRRCGNSRRGYYKKIEETGNKILTAVRLSQFSRGRDVEQVCEVNFNGIPYSPYIREDGFVSLKLSSQQHWHPACQ